MKNLLIILIVLTGTGVKSQNVAACNNAQNICSNPNFLFQGVSGDGFPGPLPVSNPGANPQTGNGNNPAAAANQGCLQTNGPGPQWLILTVSVAGNLGFTFGAPGSANPQVGMYDWAMWPYTPTTCTNLFNNTLPPVSCNWNTTPSGGTGMGPVPAGSAVGNYQPSIPVTAGQQFLILISNYSGVTTPVSFASTGTASLTCGFNGAICAGATTTVAPVGFVPLSNQTFTLMPLGLTNTTGVFTVTPSTTTTYTLTGGGTNSQNQQVIQTSTTSIVVNPQPLVAPTTTQTSCTSTLNAFNFNLGFNPGGTPGYTVNWAGVPNGITASSQTSLSGSIMSGAYSATVTAVGGCSAVANFTLNPQPAQANYTLNPYGSSFSLTCAHPFLDINATQPSFSYTWTNGAGAPVITDAIAFTTANIGTWTITGVNPISGCSATHVFTVGQNFVAPTAIVSPTNQVINCTNLSPQTVTATATPSTNVTHYFYAPSGGVVSAPGQTAIYVPGPGTYTHCVVNDVNGCSSCRNFTVATSDLYPTVSVTSLVNGVPGFTLGCSTKSAAVITVDGQSNPPVGGSATFTLLPPPPYGPYTTSGAITAYTVHTPGIWTAVVKNPAPSFCETRIQFSVIQDIAGPDIHADVPVSILSCDTHSTILTAITSNTNVQFTWLYTGVPGSLTSPTLAVNTTINNQSSAVDTYTLKIMDNNNLCTSTLTVPIRQNLYPPKAGISGGATLSITCNAPLVNFVSSSTTSIPAGSGLTTNSFVVASLWEGPSPQMPLQLSSTYIGAVAGTYTLTVKDLNNGCTSQTTTVLRDEKNFPVINNPTGPGDFTLDCGANNIKIYTINTGSVTNLSYLWTAPLQASTSAITSASLTTNAPGFYKVLVTNNISGCRTVGTASVVPGNLNGSFYADHVSGYAPLNVTFTNNSNSSLNTESITTVWSFGNGTNMITNSASLTTNAIYSQPGTYTVTAYVNKGACQDTAVRIIHVDIPSKIEAPNVFTPNGDGVNDFFFLKVANLTEINALIFDRWGHKVYELNSSTGNIAWDGKTETGKEAAAGTYFYMIKASGKDGQSYDTKGTVNLYR